MKLQADGGTIMNPYGSGTRIRHRFYVQARVLLGLLFLCCCSTNFTSGLPLDRFYPFDLTTDNQTVPKDDTGSPMINLGVNFTFFNRTDLNRLYVNNNGIISFLKTLTTYKPTLFNRTDLTGLPTIPVVAPYWSDVDIENVKEGNFNETVIYRLTNDSSVLDLASMDIRSKFIGQANFSAEEVLIVTWYNVGFYGATGKGKMRRNLFQTVLVTDGDMSFVIFNYNKTVWTTGSNSAGDTQTGLGGEAAVVGFYGGRPGVYYMIPTSGSDGILNISRESNVDAPGKFMFRVDGDINDLSCYKHSELKLSQTWVSMLGGDILTISGPCFNSAIQPMARFRDIDVTFPCHVTGDQSAKCVTPPVFKTGDLVLELNPYGTGWDMNTIITSINLLNVEPQLVRENTDEWLAGKMVRVSWDPDATPSEVRRLEVLGFSKTAGVPELQSTRNHTVGQGRTSIRFKLLSIYEYSSLVIRLCWDDPEHASTLPVCIWSDVFPVRSSSQESEDWCETWLEADRLLPKVDIREPFCPCILAIASSDLGHFTPDPSCDIDSNRSTNCTYNPGAKQCFRRNIKSPTDNGETCCYDDAGELMDLRGGPGAGTHQRYHYKAQGDDIVPFFSYFEEDLLPRLHCCQYSSRNCTHFRKRRPETTCAGYSPPSAAQAAGDPHLVTLDGKNYSFNGLGDYYLLTDISETLVVQVRAVRALNDKGKLQNATVFTNVAMAMPGVSDIVEIRKTESGHDVLVNGRLHTDTTSQFNNISLSTRPDGTHVILLEPISVSILVTVTPDLLNIMALIGEPSLEGNLRGLLGNYNGDPSDDFIPRNSSTPLPVTSKMREIHYDFGMTWLVPLEKSILSAPKDVIDVSYTPLFLDEFAMTMPADVATVCADNEQCKFDYAVTEKKSVAAATKSFSEKFDTLKSALAQKVVFCPFLDTPENGNKSSNSRSEGTVARFSCDPGYEMSGSTERVCKADSTWTGSSVSCTVKLSGGTAEIGVVVIGSVSVAGGAIIILIVVCVIYFHRRRRKKRTEGTDPERIELPPVNIPVFENQNFMHSLHSLTKDGRFKIPRPNFVDPSIFQEYF